MTKNVETLSDTEDTSLTPTRNTETLLRLCEKVSESVSQKEIKSNVHFKLLVPSVAAGAIIGKGGEAITEIQNKTSTKVKMSKANDFYPVESILRVFRYISEKIYEKPETILRSTSKGARTPTERHKQVKILVPNSTAGIIIGKGGSFIKEVKDTFGVFIQVSQRSKELNLVERCVTIAGELPQTYEAVVQLLLKIAGDPQSSSCPNISYAEVPRPVASAYPTGSPYAFVMGPGFNIDSNSMPSGNSESPNLMMSPESLPPLAEIIVSSSTPQFPVQHLTPFGPISPVETMNSPTQVYGSSPHSFAAAMAAIGVVASTGNRGHYSSHSAVGRALTGRGHSSSIGHQHQSQISYGLLGAASPNPLASSLTAPLHGLSSSSGFVSNSATGGACGGSGGLETVKNVLRSAGYTDAATDEIANAMHVLNVYGFISMSSLFDSGFGPSTMATSVNNNHFSTTSSPRSGYLSTGPPSPAGFTNPFFSCGGGNSSFRSGLAPFQSHQFRTPHFTSAYSSNKTISFTSNNIPPCLPSTSAVTPPSTDLSLHDNLSVSTSTLRNHCDVATDAPLVISSPPAGLFTTLPVGDLLSMHNHTSTSSSQLVSLSDTALMPLQQHATLLTGIPAENSNLTTSAVNGCGRLLPTSRAEPSGSDRDESPLRSTRIAADLWSASGSTRQLQQSG